MEEILCRNYKIWKCAADFSDVLVGVSFKQIYYCWCFGSMKICIMTGKRKILTQVSNTSTFAPTVDNAVVETVVILLGHLSWLSNYLFWKANYYSS